MNTRSRAAQRLRSALEESRSGYERARLALRRDPTQALDLSWLGRSAPWLATDSADEALMDAADSGEVTPDQCPWLERQLAHTRCLPARLQAEVRLGRALGSLRLASNEAFEWPAQLVRLTRVDDARARADASRELEHALRPIAAAHAVAISRALAPAETVHASAAQRPAPTGLLIISPFSPEALAPSPATLPAETWAATAEQFLSETDAAAEDAVRHCLRAFKVVKPIPWHLLMRGLRAPELDSSSGAQQRAPRASAWLRGLGFTGELQSRMRAEPDRGAASPLSATVTLAVPFDVRMAQATLDFGVASDAFAAEGVGRALGVALTSSALPAELRWPLGPTAAGVLGGLALQLWGDREHLQRVQGLPEASAERVGRLSGTMSLLFVRAMVALAASPRLDPEDAQAGMEAWAEPLSRALCCEVPPSLGALIAADIVAIRARGLEHLAALAIHRQLRERFDGDWFRNPRAGDFLRSACERGNTLGPEALCAELGTSIAAAGPRAIELVS